jgi:hypothetical protein
MSYNRNSDIAERNGAALGIATREVITMSDIPPSPASIFRRSTKSKPRPRRERSLNESLGDEASASDSLGHSVEQQDELSREREEKKEESPMVQVAKLKARQKARVKGPQARLSFGADDDQDEVLALLYIPVMFHLLAMTTTERRWGRVQD